jgi:hypothetical protein
VVEICEIGTVNTGSAALKKPAVAQVYSTRISETPLVEPTMLTVTKMGWIVVR